MQKQISVGLDRVENDVFLVFNFDNPLKLNLCSDNQQEVKKFFQDLLKIIFEAYHESDTEYSLLFNDEHDDLYHDVAKKYVGVLMNEIQGVYSSFKV